MSCGTTNPPRMHPSLRYSLYPAQPDPSFRKTWLMLPSREKHRFIVLIARRSDADTLYGRFSPDDDKILCFPKKSRKSSFSEPVRSFKLTSQTVFKSKHNGTFFTYIEEESTSQSRVRKPQKGEQEVIVFVSRTEMCDAVVSSFGRQVPWPDRIIFVVSRYVDPLVAATEMVESGRFEEEWAAYRKKAPRHALLSMVAAFAAKMHEMEKETPDAAAIGHLRAFLFYAGMTASSAELSEACFSSFASKELTELLTTQKVAAAGLGLGISADPSGEKQRRLTEAIYKHMAKKGDAAVLPNIIGTIDRAIGRAKEEGAVVTKAKSEADMRHPTISEKDAKVAWKQLLIALNEIKSVIGPLTNIVDQNYKTIRHLSCFLANNDKYMRKKQEAEIDALIKAEIGIEPEPVLQALRTLIAHLTQDLLYRKIFWDVEILWEITRHGHRKKWKPVEEIIASTEEQMQKERNPKRVRELDQQRLAAMSEIRSVKDGLVATRDTMRRQLGLIFRAIVPYHWATGLSGNMHMDVFLLTISIRGVGANNIAPILSPQTAGLFLLCDLIREGETSAISTAQRIPPTCVPSLPILSRPDKDVFGLKRLILKPEQLKAAAPAYGLDVMNALKNDLGALVLIDADPVSKALIRFVMELLMCPGDPSKTFPMLLGKVDYLAQALDVLETRGFPETSVNLFALLARRLFIPRAFKAAIHPPVYTISQAKKLGNALIVMGQLASRWASRLLFYGVAIFVNTVQQLVHEATKARMYLDSCDSVLEKEDDVKNLFAFDTSKSGMSRRALVISLTDAFVFNPVEDRNALAVALKIALPPANNPNINPPNDHSAWHAFTQEVTYPLTREGLEMWRAVWNQAIHGMYDHREMKVNGAAKTVGVPRRRTYPFLWALEHVLCIPSVVGQKLAAELLNRFGFSTRWVKIFTEAATRSSVSGFGTLCHGEAAPAGGEGGDISVNLVRAVNLRLSETESIFVPERPMASDVEATGKLDKTFIIDPLGAVCPFRQVSEIEVLFELAKVGHLTSVVAAKDVPQTNSSEADGALPVRDSTYIESSLTYIVRTYGVDAIRKSRGALFPSFVDPVLSILASRPYLATESHVFSDLKAAILDAGSEAGVVRLDEAAELTLPGQRHSLQHAVIEKVALPLNLRDLLSTGLFTGSVSSFRQASFLYAPSGADFAQLSYGTHAPLVDEDAGSESCEEYLYRGRGVITDAQVPITPHLSPDTLALLFQQRRGDIIATWLTLAVTLHAIADGRNIAADPLVRAPGKGAKGAEGGFDLSSLNVPGLPNLIPNRVSEIYETAADAVRYLGELRGAVAQPILDALLRDERLKRTVARPELTECAREALDAANIRLASLLIAHVAGVAEGGFARKVWQAGAFELLRQTLDFLGAVAASADDADDDAPVIDASFEPDVINGVTSLAGSLAQALTRAGPREHAAVVDLEPLLETFFASPKALQMTLGALGHIFDAGGWYKHSRRAARPLLSEAQFDAAVALGRRAPDDAVVAIDIGRLVISLAAHPRSRAVVCAPEAADYLLKALEDHTDKPFLVLELSVACTRLLRLAPPPGMALKALPVAEALQRRYKEYPHVKEDVYAFCRACGRYYSTDMFLVLRVLLLICFVVFAVTLLVWGIANRGYVSVTVRRFLR
eukprot:gnl/Chilomastix_cuspidata/809.p1 GENE.gnl/Chilomastix_cuspidata/809~~gnl/Chilomastix_cuspidata/809.p1  ORF type:complete len:1647 (+),score=889.89 gnl/Chilomastix_cuspidata/809:27-4967(+)